MKVDGKEARLFEAFEEFGVGIFLQGGQWLMFSAAGLLRAKLQRFR